MQRKWPFSYNYLDILGNIRPSYLGNYGFVDLTLQQTRLQLGFPWKMFALFGDKSGEGIHCFWNHMKSGFKETSVGSMPSRFPKSFSWPFGDGFIICCCCAFGKKVTCVYFSLKGVLVSCNPWICPWSGRVLRWSGGVLRGWCSWLNCPFPSRNYPFMVVILSHYWARNPAHLLSFTKKNDHYFPIPPAFFQPLY